MANFPSLGPLIALDSAGAGASLIFGAPLLLVLGYVLLVWDARREGSSSKDDGQVGLKQVLYFILVVGLGVAAGGLDAVLHYLLSGTKVGSGQLKSGAAGLVAGGAVVFAVQTMLLPRTNAAEHPKATRYATGYVAALAGMTAVLSFTSLLGVLLSGASLVPTMGALSTVLVFGGLGFYALNRFGSLSGWVTPVKPAAPMVPGYPPQAGGFPPPQGGYPPPQGGYPPPQGGYPPPQGGGLPPPQGGYPPPGGGYPPQGGGYPGA